MYQFTAKLNFVLGINREERKGLGSYGGITLCADVVEIVMLFHIDVNSPISGMGIGKEGAVQDIHRLHHSLCRSAHHIRIEDAGIIQNKADGGIVAAVGQVLCPLTAAGELDFR